MANKELDDIIFAFKNGRNPPISEHGRASTKQIEDLIKEIYKGPLAEKPPIGIMPERIYEDKRINELCDAIKRQLKAEFPDYKLMHKWADEIYRKT